MEYVKPYLDFLGNHPDLSLAIVFLIAMGEALLVIGLFVPSTAVLVGAGILVGTGHLHFWPIFFATTVGAIAGDQISFWAGKLYGERLKLKWPLNRYPQLVAKGEDFVRGHGGKSIAIGRFVPGVKAVIPGIVGMLGMGQVYFASINVFSGIAWSALHLVPGVLIGQGLAFAGELSGRLLVVLLVLVTVLGVGGYLIRLGVSNLSPLLNHLLERVSASAKASSNGWMQRFGDAASPDNPRSLLLVVFAAVAMGGLIALAAMIARLSGSAALSNADMSVFGLMKEMRSAPGDELMITMTMLGDSVVLIAVSLTMLAWMVWRRAYRAAAAAAVTILLGWLFVPFLTLGLQRTRAVALTAGPAGFLGQPLSHATMAAVVFGILAVLVSHSLGRWSRSLVYAACGVLVIAIAYSRVYLGIHWLSDVMAGLVFGTVMTAAFGVVIETIPPRRIMPVGLFGASLIAFIVAGAAHVSWGYERAEDFYGPPPQLKSMSLAEWQAGGWRDLPRRRIDFVGKTGETFLIQYAGSLDILRLAMTAQGWQEHAKWTWRQAVPYLNPGASLAELPPRPTLHQGLKAKLTLVRAMNPNERQVIRVYKTDRDIVNHDQQLPLYMVSLTRETLRKGLDLYAIPRLVVAKYDERKALLAEADKSPRLFVIGQNDVNKLPQQLLLAVP